MGAGGGRIGGLIIYKPTQWERKITTVHSLIMIQSRSLGAVSLVNSKIHKWGQWCSWVRRHAALHAHGPFYGHMMSRLCSAECARHQIPTALGLTLTLDPAVKGTDTITTCNNSSMWLVKYNKSRWNPATVCPQSLNSGGVYMDAYVLKSSRSIGNKKKYMNMWMFQLGGDKIIKPLHSDVLGWVILLVQELLCYIGGPDQQCWRRWYWLRW